MGLDEGLGRFGPMIALGFLAGILGGLFGIGGGLIIVPALVLAFGLDQKTATGTSLFALVWPVGLLGVVEYASRGQARFDWGSAVALGLVVGVFAGARMTAPLAPATMKRAYGVFLFVVGTYFVVSAFVPSLDAQVMGGASGGLWLGVVIGTLAGVLGGLFGVGGGLVIVPALKILASLDQKTAVGTSLFAQVWPVGILGVLEYRRRGESRADFGVAIAVGLLIGNLVGAWLTRPLPQSALQALYGVFCVAVGVYYRRTRPKRIASTPTAVPKKPASSSSEVEST